jgi:hypothetical protein
LTNILPSKHTLRALTNGGQQDLSLVADFPNLGDVWFNCASIAIILSLAEVRKVCRVTMDTGVESAICVHRLDGSLMEFVEHPCGLFVFDTRSSMDPTSSANVPIYTMVTTVADQRKLFTRREVAAADQARDLYRKICRPSEAEFQCLLRRNQIRNCPVTPNNAARALIIYCPDLATLKGKTTRAAAPPTVPALEAVPIPPPVLAHHRTVVTLCIDFFCARSRVLPRNLQGIGFRTVIPVPDRTRSTILRETLAVIHLYTRRGFTDRALHADGKFDCIRATVLPVALDVVAAGSHVGEVERSIRTIKKRLRASVHGFPFRRLPKILITHLVANVVRCLNQFLHPNRVSNALSPASLVTGVASPDYATIRLEFGTYVQIFDGFAPTNTIRFQSLGAITLSPTGKAHGDYYFLTLASGARVSRHQWTALPVAVSNNARDKFLCKQCTQVQYIVPSIPAAWHCCRQVLVLRPLQAFCMYCTVLYDNSHPHTCGILSSPLLQLGVSQPTWNTPIPRHNRLHPTMSSKVADDARYEKQVANKRAMMAASAAEDARYEKRTAKRAARIAVEEELLGIQQASSDRIPTPESSEYSFTDEEEGQEEATNQVNSEEVDYAAEDA